MKHYNASGSVVQISQKCGINFAEVWYKKSDNPLFYKTLKALKFP